jgi:transcriptional regulator with XRE-family HTH domain
MSDAATFGEKLTARRKQLSLSQSAAARKAGVDRMTWRAWELDKSTPQDYNDVRIEHTMKWAPGSVRAMLRGGDPTYIEAPSRTEDEPLDDAERELWALKYLTVDEIRMYVRIHRDMVAREKTERDATRHDDGEQNSA